MSTLSISRAINRALADALAADPTVVVFGEDVAGSGGAFFVVTLGLQARIPEQVFDTPIAEAAITGAALGAALSGLKPVVEIMFMDFIALAMDQLVNQAAKAHFMFGGQTSAPLVVRTPHGGGQSAGPQHSQCLEAWLAHVPGLRVVCPSTPADAYGLLRVAINDPNPCSSSLKTRRSTALKDEFPDAPADIAIGTARIARPGRDVTVIAYGAAVRLALDAAASLSGESIEIEVIDLRSIQPWDKSAVLASIAKTHRAIVVHEAVTSFGPGAEVAATIAHEGFDDLDAPILRVGAAFMPVPFSPALETASRPSVARLIAAVHEVMR